MPKKPPSLARVTSVLSYVNAEWYKHWLRSLDSKGYDAFKEAERISRESTEFGRNVHKIVETYLKDGMAIDKPDRTAVCANHIIKWLYEVKAKPLYIEQELIDKKLGLIGHCDLIAEINGHNYLIDFKTSKALKRDMPLQLAAYSYMAENQFKIKIDNGVIIRTPKDPEADPQFEVQEYHGLRKTYWPVFKQCLQVYQYFERKGKWRKTI